MNKITKKILDKVNSKISDHNFFYIAKEAERGLGLEKLINNYQIVCKENDHIAQSVNALIFEDVRNTTELLTKNQKIKEGDVVQTFYHQITLYSKLIQRKCKILNPNPSFSKIFEDKIKVTKFLETTNVKIPKFKITTLDIDAIKNFPSKKMVIQLPKGHTGIGTLILDKDENPTKKIKEFSGSVVKISEFIEGIPLTVNACITKNGVFISGLQYQITGVPEACNGDGVTVGNDWGLGYKISKNHGKKIIEVVKKIGLEMQKLKFAGLFGLDLIVNDDVWVIEINSRQTANIPMQTKIELKKDVVPLSLLHIAHFMNIDFNYSPENEFAQLEGSQIFLRAKKKTTIKNALTSGVYRLQSDNSAMNWDNGKPLSIKDNVIFLDENKDMPIIFQNSGYSIDDIMNGGFLILGKKSGSIKNYTDELARFQFKESIVQDNFQVKPWILKLLSKIEEYIL